MASIAPITQWWDENETSQQSQWDAGVVDAGSESVVTTFHLWNNRGNSSTAVSDMINVDITVRDINGQTQDLSIAGQTDGIVMCQFFNATTNKWGAYVDDVWTVDAWAELIYTNPQPVVSANGTKRTISGAVNNGSASADTSNFAAIRLKLFAKPTATAGQVSWLTRVSYQYQ